VNEPTHYARGGTPAVSAIIGEAGGEATLTRGRAIKLAGAALFGGVLTVLWPAEADAKKKKKKKKNKKKKRRRRRRNDVTSSDPSVTFGNTTVGGAPGGPETVTITNEGTEPVMLRPEISGGDAGAFSISPSVGDFTLQPGDTQDLALLFAPIGAGLQEAVLLIRDTRDGLVVEEIPLVGTGVLP